MTKQEFISHKIGILIKEGRTKYQAAAIAYSMWEKGDKKQEGGDIDNPQTEDYFKKLQNVLKNYTPALQPLPVAQMGGSYTNSYTVSNPVMNSYTKPGSPEWLIRKSLEEDDLSEEEAQARYSSQKHKIPITGSEVPEIWRLIDSFQKKDEITTPVSKFGKKEEVLPPIFSQHKENWDTIPHFKQGGELPMAQEGIDANFLAEAKRTPLYMRTTEQANVISKAAYLNRQPQILEGSGNTPFQSQNFGIPVSTPYDSSAKGFYPTQDGTFQNSLSYGKTLNPNYGTTVTAGGTQPSTNFVATTPPTTGIPQTKVAPQQKAPTTAVVPPVVTPTAASTASVATTAAQPTSAVTAVNTNPGFQYVQGDYNLSGDTSTADNKDKFGNATGANNKDWDYIQGDANGDGKVDGKDSVDKFGNPLATNTASGQNQDWIKYNILNPHAGGMDLGTSLAYTGQQFGQGHTGMGVAGAGLSLLKGARNFLSGYGAGKSQQNLEQEYHDKMYNNDEGLYEMGQEGGYMQQGGLTNADLLTGNYQENSEQPNIEVEDGEHTKNSETGQVKEVVGKTHLQGGEAVNLPDQSKVLSDYTKIGAGNVKLFSDTFDVKLKASDTFATVLDKYNNKIGVKKLEEEEKELLEKLEKNDNSSIDKTTKKINEDFLAQEISEVNKKKEALNKAKSEAFDMIFNEQEKIPKKGDGTQILDKSGNPVKEEGGHINSQYSDIINNKKILSYTLDKNTNSYIVEYE